MNLTTQPSSRRSFLRQQGRAIALPFLASLLAANERAAAEKSLVEGRTPKRLLWMSMGHGHMEKHFYPTEFGSFSKIELPSGFDPLRKNLSHTTMVSNLTNKENKQPHEGSEAVLTCANVVGFSGRARHNSISCDQVAAAHLGTGTRYQSLQLNCPSTDTGNGHGGVAMSYRVDGSPLPGLHSPLKVYHKLFGGNVGKDEVLRTLKQRRSIFDILELESSSSKRVLSKDDRDKLEEYTTSIRDIERSISREEEWLDVPYPKATLAPPNEGKVLESGSHGEAAIRVMFKMIITAFQTDATRVITYRMPDAGLLKSMDISSTPHTLSHYGSNTSLHELNLRRTRKWMELYSEFIDQLRSSNDPLDPKGGTIFDNSLVFFGGGLRTAHRNKNIPCLLTGGGFQGLTHGQHRKAPEEDTPLANLWTTMLQDAGAPIDRFADANATASSIWGESGRADLTQRHEDTKAGLISSWLCAFV